MYHIMTVGNNALSMERTVSMAVPATAAASTSPLLVGVDALGARSWCLKCARDKGLVMGEPDAFGEPVTAILTSDEFVEIMECDRCGKYLMPLHLVRRIKAEQVEG